MKRNVTERPWQPLLYDRALPGCAGWWARRRPRQRCSLGLPGARASSATPSPTASGPLTVRLDPVPLPQMFLGSHLPPLPGWPCVCKSAPAGSSDHTSAAEFPTGDASETDDPGTRGRRSTGRDWPPTRPVHCLSRVSLTLTLLPCAWHSQQPGTVC